jgi:formate dehydrogenase iron-sulfur subunit
MTVKVYVPRDSSALSLGADRTAKAIAAEAQKRGITIELIRNGSRGLFWLAFCRSGNQQRPRGICACAS